LVKENPFGDIMVVIEISKKDLLNLVGMELSDQQIEDTLFLIKVEGEISDDTITCELNPDRPDLFSVEGVAREMKGFLGLRKGLVKYEVADSKVTLKKERSEVRPVIYCAIIKDVELSDELVKSLMQVQEKLHITIGRDRKKVAIGVHDFGKMEPPLVYRDVGDETFVPLGENKEMNIKQILSEHAKGKDYAHLVKDSFPLIYDKKGVISFPPIINSERTRVTKNTKSLFIDVTGTDEKAVSWALNILVCNITERSGKIESVKVSNKKTPDLRPRERSILIEKVDRILGIGLHKNDIVECLEKMGYGITSMRGEKIGITIPAYRLDIIHDIDVIEDVAIGYGFDKIEPILPKLSTIGGQLSLAKLSKRVRELMIGLDFQEVVTFVLTNRENNLNKMNIEGNVVEILNPTSSEYNVCRAWLLPNLLKVLSSNKHVEYPQKIFEVGEVVVFDDQSPTGVRNIRKLAGVISYDNANLTEMKSIIETVLYNLSYKYAIDNLSHSSFIETRAGEIIVDGNRVGLFGEIHPKVIENWKLEKPVIGFELLLI
jgi:phenylalanyl-tRNA synthetase beta chain